MITACTPAYDIGLSGPTGTYDGLRSQRDRSHEPSGLPLLINKPQSWFLRVNFKHLSTYMASTRDTDAEPGFGRRGDNSSRESSPIRKHKRSFSPTSDDEVVISIADDDDTPPPDGPIIRQAVAFSWTPSIPTAPASINTYQASPLPTKKHNTFFLPGQAVPAPPPPPKPPKTKKKKSAAGFSSQTGRFRVTSYDPTPSASPALTSGDGPYASMYRAKYGAPGNTEVETVPPPEEVSSSGRKRSKPSDSRPKASTSRAKVMPSKAKPSASKGKASDLGQGSSSVSFSMSLPTVPGPQAAPSRPYYRRDYEQHDDHASSSHSVPEGPPSPRQELRRSQAHKRSNAPLRLVTVLIADMRGEVPDHQLVEVRVVLRDSEDVVQDGYWANAEDICKTLQASVSRIDGPAKVYALRGKYRQMILKVTADNDDDWVTANVVVNPDRTLDVVVETGVPPGGLARPSRARRDIPESRSSISPPRATAPLPYMDAGFGVRINQEHGHRKRRHSPSDDYRGMASSSRQWSPSTLASSPRRSPSRGTSTSHQNSFVSGAPGARMLFPGHHSSSQTHSPPNHMHLSKRQRGNSVSESSESEDEEASVVDEVDELIQQEKTWTDYFVMSAKPRSAAAVLKEYRIVQGFIDKWAGKPVPSGPLIEPSHIAMALKIENPQDYINQCTDTIRLMELYGPEGRRLQDPEVAKKAGDDSEPGYSMNPARRLWKLLRKIDEDWVAAHPVEPVN
ncbi:hypothetical protein B0H11DRAFT_386957 [Mycena galericulata]|nr:hypothetical protein B0H11DRAFT_386957 [Mycena galericulata]